MSATKIECAVARPQWMDWAGTLTLIAFLFALYMPGAARDALFLLALVVAYSERRRLVLDAGIRRIAYAMVIYIVVFTVLSTDAGRSAKGAYDMLRGMLAFFVGYLLALQCVDGRKLAVLTVGALLMLLGNLAFYNPYREFGFYGYFPNPNNSAVAIIMFTIFSVPPFGKFPGHRVVRALGAVGFLLGTYLLVLTNARGAWLGLFGASVVLLFLLPRVGRRQRIAMSIVLACGLAGAVLWANVKGFSLSERDLIWKGLLSDAWHNRPWFGYGLNSIKDVLAELNLPTQTAHNLFLEIFVASGAFGLAYMIAFISGAVRYFAGFRYADSSQLYIGAMGIAAYLIMAQLDLKMSSFTFMASVSLLLGMIYSQRRSRIQS